MKTQALGVAVIGAGRAGMIHAENFMRAVPGARVVAIADPVPESLQRAAASLDLQAAAFSDYQTALQQPHVDAVVIATPTALHREIAVAAAKAGKHIFCEKPMAMNVPDCEAMITAANRSRVVLQIGFMRR